MTTITVSGSLLANYADAMGPVTTPTHQAPLQQLTRSLERFQPKACPGLDPGWIPVRVKKTRQIKKLEPRFDSVETATALVAVAAADVDPLRSIGRPGSAPTAVVGGVGERRADERKPMEAVMEAVATEREA